MYVKEMHIEVNQSLQKIAANRTRKFFDEEVDWLLNKNLSRFIQSRVTPKKDGSGGFEIKQFDIDAIQAILVRGREVPAYVADPRSYKAQLPGDYAYLISDESVIKLAPVDLTNTPTQPLSSVLARNLLVIPIPPSTLPVGPYYNNVSMSINGGVVFDIQLYTQQRSTTFTGYNSKDQVYEVSDCLLRELSDQKWSVYWERYAEMYYPRCLVIDTGAVVATASITIDGTTTPAKPMTYTVQVYDYPTQPTQDQSNRLTASHIVQNLREVAFYKTQPESPISEISQRQLYTYTNKYFTVTSNRLSYVRKPRRISLTLGDDCDLAPEYHQLICDLTVEYVKGMISDPNWEVKLKDNMVRTPI